MTAKGRIENKKSARIGSNQDTTIKAAGLTNDGTLSALGQIDVNVGDALENTGTLGAGKNLNVTAKGWIENKKSARIGSNQDTTIKTAGLTNDGTLSALGQIDVNVGDALENTGTLGAGKNLNVTAKGRIENKKSARIGSNQDTTIKAAGLTNHGMLSALKKTDINVTGTLRNEADAEILGHAKGSAITARALINAGDIRAIDEFKLDMATLDNQSRGKIQANRLRLSAASQGGRTIVWDNSGLIATKQQLDIDSSGKLTNQAGGRLLSRGTLALTTGQLDNLGEISAKHSLTIRASGAIANPSSGKLLSEQILHIRAGALTNSGKINAGAGLDIQVTNNLNNYAAGLMQSKTADVMVVVAGSLTNRGAIAAAQNLNVRSPVLNNLEHEALLLAGKNLRIEGAISRQRSALLKNERGRILTLDGDIDILTRRLDNLSPVTITSKTVTVRNRFRPGRPPAVPFFPGYISRAGYDQLYDGGRTRTYVFVPHPEELQRILKAEGRTMASWKEYDWENYWRSGNGNHYDPAKWSFIVPDEANGFTSGVAELKYKEDVVVSAAGRAELAAHGRGDMRIDATTINNINSIISSANDLRLDGGTLNNEGQTLHRELSLKIPQATDTVRVQGWIRQWLFGSGSIHLSTETIGKVQGIIAAGRDLSGSLTGSVNNLSKPASVPDTPSFAKTPVTALKINQTENPVLNLAANPSINPAINPSINPSISSAISSAINTAIDPARPSAIGFNYLAKFGGLFRPATKANFVLETRFQFINVRAFYGSEYFMRRLGYKPDRRQRFLGDAYFDTQFVNRQILEQAGRRFLYADSRNDTKQMKRLLEQGLAAAGDLQLSPWVSLSREQQALLTEDIVWYEPMVYQGETVLAPRLYLASKGRSRLSAKGAIISARNIDLRVGNTITNSGAIEAQGNLRLTARNDIQNIRGRIKAGADLRIESLEGSILNQNEIRRIEYDAQNVLEYELGKSEIFAGKDLIIKAGKDITNLASTIRAEGNASLKAGKNINLLAGRREAAYYVRDSKGFYRQESTVHDTGAGQRRGPSEPERRPGYSLSSHRHPGR